MTAGAVRRFEVEHRTAYEYGAVMTDGYTVACLVPRPTELQHDLTGHRVDVRASANSIRTEELAQRRHSRPPRQPPWRGAEIGSISILIRIGAPL